MKKQIWIPILIVAIIVVVGAVLLTTNKQKPLAGEIKVGYIGAITGPVAKYGSYEAVQLAVEDINNSGGINGAHLKLIAEDGKCNGKDAIDAVNKLINIDKVKVILGGHCTPESASIAPIVEKNKIIMLASITTSPVLTDMGDYVFRTSPVSVVQSELVANLAYNNLGLKNLAIIYELTDYARPIAEKMNEKFTDYGGQVSLFESYTPGIIDFRTLLTKAKNKGVDSIFISAQSPDAALNFMKQVKELGLDNVQIFGNDVAGTQAIIDQMPELYEGFILALPNFDTNSKKTAKFINEYKEKYNVGNIPYGIWTAESYDAVFIIADALKKYGENPDKIKEYLYNVKNYDGVSGKITIDKNGDGVRSYFLKIVKDGKIVDYDK